MRGVRLSLVAREKEKEKRPAMRAALAASAQDARPPRRVAQLWYYVNAPRIAPGRRLKNIPNPIAYIQYIYHVVC